MRTHLTILFSSLLLFLATFFWTVQPAQAAGGCACLSATGVVGFAFCQNVALDRPDSAACLNIGPVTTCSCSPDPTCGAHGQPACKVVPNWVRSIYQAAVDANVADSFKAFLLAHGIDYDQGMQQDNNKCRDAGDKAFNVNKGGGIPGAVGLWICAATQQEAEGVHNQTISAPTFNLCNETGGNAKCSACVDQGGVWTAVGCIKTKRNDIVTSFLTIAISLSGGVILLRLLQASFMLSTSQGEPNKVKEAQEVFTSSFAGLLFVLFSIVILNVIGVKILQIPGF